MKYISESKTVTDSMKKYRNPKQLNVFYCFFCHNFTDQYKLTEDYFTTSNIAANVSCGVLCSQQRDSDSLTYQATFENEIWFLKMYLEYEITVISSCVL